MCKVKKDFDVSNSFAKFALALLAVSTELQQRDGKDLHRNGYILRSHAQ